MSGNADATATNAIKRAMISLVILSLGVIPYFLLLEIFRVLTLMGFGIWEKATIYRIIIHKISFI